MLFMREHWIRCAELRMMSLKFSLVQNVVSVFKITPMYALAINYKKDQVHIPFIIQRRK